MLAKRDYTAWEVCDLRPCKNCPSLKERLSWPRVLSIPHRIKCCTKGRSHICLRNQKTQILIQIHYFLALDLEQFSGSLSIK